VCACAELMCARAERSPRCPAAAGPVLESCARPDTCPALHLPCPAHSMLKEEGMANVVARHHRLAEGTRKAVEGWGLELLYTHPRCTCCLMGLSLLKQQLWAGALAYTC
jgi:hypothetical protein